MEFIKFLFSSGWHFTGFVLLVLIGAAVIVCIIREVKKQPTRDFGALPGESDDDL